LYSSLPPANHIFLTFNHFSFYFILFSMSRGHVITCRAYRTPTEPTEIIPMTNHTLPTPTDISEAFSALFPSSQSIHTASQQPRSPTITEHCQRTSSHSRSMPEDSFLLTPPYPLSAHSHSDSFIYSFILFLYHFLFSYLSETSIKTSVD